MEKFTPSLALLASTEVVVCTPSGGLNDSLCMIENAWRRAEQRGCHLVVDVAGSWMGATFGEVFTFPPETVTVLSTLEEAAFFYAFALERSLTIEKTSGKKGGQGSLALLGRVTLGKRIVEAHLRERSEIGTKYDAVHIRHSDYKTAFRPVLKKVARLSKAEKIWLVTDGHEVAVYGAAYFGPRVHLAKRVWPKDGTPLHKQKNFTESQRPQDVLEEAVLDLLGAAWAERFYYTTVFRVGHPSLTTISGFGQLVAGLRGFPKHLEQLTGLRGWGPGHTSVLVVSCHQVAVALWRQRIYPMWRKVSVSWNKRRCRWR